MNDNALDLVGNKDLTVVGANYTASNPNGIFLKSAFFDDLNDYMHVSDTGLPAGNSERSFAILYYNDGVASSAIFDYGTKVNGQRLLVTNMTPDGTNALGISVTGHRVVSPNNVLVLGWNLAIVTVPSGATTSGHITTNINGSEETLSSSAGSPVTLNTTLGTFDCFVGSNVTTGGRFSGQISQFAIYDVAMTTQQKSDLWNNGDFKKILGGVGPLVNRGLINNSLVESRLI